MESQYYFPLSRKGNEMWKILKNIATKQSVNLNSDEWCELIFENKNKVYGAYEMRMTTNKRHLMAFILTILLSFGVIFSSIVIDKIKEIILVPSHTGCHFPYGPIYYEGEAEEGLEIFHFFAPKISEETVIPRQASIGIKIEEEFIEETFYQDIEGLDEEHISLPDGAIYCTLDPQPIQPIYLEIIEEGYQKEPHPSGEVRAQFPGGEKEFERYVRSNLHYSLWDIEEGREGRVVVQFTVTETGEIEHIKILRSMSPICDRAVLRMLKSMPKWIPAKRGGRAVSMQFTLPIQYNLE